MHQIGFGIVGSGMVAGLLADAIAKTTAGRSTAQRRTMRNVITQSVELPSTKLFQMYLDPVLHGAITGFPVTIGREPGSAFSAFEGKLSGTMLVVIEPRLIVQSWRSVNFKPDDPDSTLILSISETPTIGRIDLNHIDVPIQDLAGVTEGWHKFYWEPWKRYLSSQSP